MQHKLITLPLFPLNFVILPGESKMLHIYETRYKELLKDCLDNGAHFAVAYQKNNRSSGSSSKAQIAEYGVTVKITRVLKTSVEGETDIMVQGLDPFKIQNFISVLPPKLYGAASIEPLQDPHITENTELFDSLTKYFVQLKNRDLQNDLDFGVSVYQVASLLELTNEEKIQLIALDTLRKKEDFLVNKIRLFVHLLTSEKKLNGEFWLN
jgi:ATP-dependent Lon protease